MQLPSGQLGPTAHELFSGPIGGGVPVAPALTLAYYFKTRTSQLLPESERRIEEARKTKAASLNLSRMGLRQLPDDVCQLAELTHLDLAENQLTVLPESLGQLQQLQSLELRHNHLTRLPESIGQLKQLEELYLVGN